MSSTSARTKKPGDLCGGDEAVRNDKETFWAAVVAHQKTDYVPMYSLAVANIGGQREWWENGPAGGGKDAFGVAWAGTESAGGAGVPLGNPIVLEDVTRWEERVSFPDLDAIPWRDLADAWLAGIDRERQYVNYSAYNAQFERVTHLMGFVEGLCAFTEEPEATAALLHAITDYKIAALERISHYMHPDFYTPFDDLATQRSLFISPAVYRALVLPEHRRVNDACRALGIQPILHCCGRCEALIEDFIDAGFTAWASAQPVNDIARITRDYGGRIAVIGGYDTNGVPGTMEASDAAVADEVDRCLTQYGAGTGYVFSGMRMPGARHSRDEAMAPILKAYGAYAARF